MKQRKKAVLLALAALLAFALVFAGCDLGLGRVGTFGDFEWRLDGGNITITGYTGSGGAVTIPAEINGNPVRNIGSWAFRDNQLISITIPSSVTSIGGVAFADNQLTSITIPSSVTFIGDGAFSNNRLTSITIPSSVTSIRAVAFADNQLTSVTIPSSVTYIGGSAFVHNQLTSITVPPSVTSIGQLAFASNQCLLISITIGANVTLASDAFRNGFEAAYNAGGRQAGTYTRPNTDSRVWTRQ